MRVEHAIDRAASLVPDNVALRYGDRTWTFAELRAERDRRAGVLVEAGLRVGDRLVAAERVSDEQVITFLACARAGGIFAGFSALLTAPELAALTARLTPRIACTTTGQPLPGLCAQQTLPIDLPGTPSAAALCEAARRSSAVDEEAPCDIRITSGTTGQRPRLILHPHRTHVGRFSGEAWTSPLADVLSVLVTTHLQVSAICRAFVLGGVAVIPRTVGIYGLEAELAAHGVTHATGTPALLRALTEQSDPPPPTLRLRRIQTTGASLPAEVAQAAADRYGATIAVRYGMSECFGIMMTPETGAPAGSIGKPLPGVDVRLIGDDGQPLGDGQVGELVVRSRSMMLCYYDDPEATARALRDGWLHTGDNAWRDACGFYYLVGRRGLQINVGSMKVTPEEVEAVLARHPGVREVVVVPQPDWARGEVVKAIVVPEGDAPDAQALRRFCRAHLAGYKVPRSIEFRDEPLPRSALGKVLRQQL
jgi:acyl-coenzyme A synthetase/AMP-(fatty) acid ligase